MCLIFACWSGKPTEDELERAAEANKDGAGICWVDLSDKKNTENRVHWIKGLDSSVEVVNKVLKDRKIKYPYAIHFRTASIGGVTPLLTHPFPLEPEADMALEGTTRRCLMHNGHMSNWEKWVFPIMVSEPQYEIPIGPWSDSRALAIAGALKGEGVFRFINEGSRILVMDSLPCQGWDPKLPVSYIRRSGSGWINEKNRGFATSQTIPNRNFNRWTDHRACNPATPSTSSSTHKPTDEAVWTVEELEEITKQLSKESQEALVIAGAD